MNLEIFPCSGGFAEGFRRAGLTFDVAFDKDPDAVASYEKNLGHAPILMDARDLLRLIEGGWRPARSINFLCADPPCTPWSRAGKRLGTSDERDMLGVTCEIIRLLRPRAYLIGNVPGLEDSKSWPALQAALEPLRREGYCIADYACLDAADYGVPQRRIRPFWFGHLDGPCITWPLPTHAAPEVASGDMFGLKPWVTCRQALGHLVGDELGRPVKLRRRGQNGKQHGSVDDKPARGVGTSNLSDGNVLVDRVVSDRHPALDPNAPAITLRGGGEGHSAPEYILDGSGEADHRDQRQPGSKPRASTLDTPAGVVTSRPNQGDGSVLTVLIVNDKHPPTDADAGGANLALTWPWPRPATTIQRDERMAPPGHHDESYSIMSDERAVLLTERAAAILQDFPDGDASVRQCCVRCRQVTNLGQWHFCAITKRGRWSMLGQAMPPGLAHAVATSVVKQLAATDLRKHTFPANLESGVGVSYLVGVDVAKGEGRDRSVLVDVHSGRVIE